MERAVPRFCLDVLLWSFAGYLAFALRLDDPRGGEPGVVFAYGLLGIPVKALLIRLYGLHLQVWHRAGIVDLWQVARAVGIGTVFLLVASAAVLEAPRSIPLIEAVIAFILLGGVRLIARLRAEARAYHSNESPVSRVIIAGAGEAGTLIAREMIRHPENGARPVAFVDDDHRKQNVRACGVPVLGPIERLAEVARRTHANEVIIAMPSAEGGCVRRVVEAARAAQLPHRIIPGVYELLGGQVTVSQVRDVNLEDVLRRAPVALNIDEISGYLNGSTVLVTGAGGSVGSEIVRQLVRFHPKRLILFGRGENSIFSIQQELNRTWPDVEHIEIIGDVRHQSHLRTVFERYRPDVVIHAAAHKHVPLMEDSPSEAIYNNVLGTRAVVELSLEFGVRRFVNISTDKAVNPTSVMGSTKRLAEMVVASAAKRAGPGQAFVSVRFGNVLGSRGSVVPTFMAQIRAGGPVTVTHPNMIRYFMLIPEAARLVLQAGGLAQNGRVYVLKMGAPVRIVDLARDVIRLSGAKNIEIVFSGIRPGEKLYEELLTADETLEPTSHGEIFVVHPPETDPEQLQSQLQLLEQLARKEDYPPLRGMIRALIPESLLEVNRPEPHPT